MIWACNQGFQVAPSVCLTDVHLILSVKQSVIIRVFKNRFYKPLYKTLWGTH